MRRKAVMRGLVRGGRKEVGEELQRLQRGGLLFWEEEGGEGRDRPHQEPVDVGPDGLVRRRDGCERHGGRLSAVRADSQA